MSICLIFSTDCKLPTKVHHFLHQLCLSAVPPCQSAISLPLFVKTLSHLIIHLDWTEDSVAVVK